MSSVYFFIRWRKEKREDEDEGNGGWALAM